MFLFPLILISLTAFLAACGGGGGTTASTSPISFSGTAIDGYLHKATVFLDLNENGTFDAGEPTANTGQAGEFTLSATQAQINTYKVVVVAVAGTTIDQDSPGTPVTSGFTMMSPPGNHEVVSPLTTQVAAKMSAGLSLEAAKTAVKTELGLDSIDVMKTMLQQKQRTQTTPKPITLRLPLQRYLRQLMLIQHLAPSWQTSSPALRQKSPPKSSPMSQILNLPVQPPTR